MALAASLIVLAALMCHHTSGGMNFVKQQEDRRVISVHRLGIARENSSEVVANLTLYFFPETAYNIREEQIRNISFGYTLKGLARGGSVLNGTFRIDNNYVASILEPRFLFEANATADLALEAAVAESNSTFVNETYAGLLPYSIQIVGSFIGRAHLTLVVRDPLTVAEDRDIETSLKFRVSVIRKRRVIDDIFQFVIWSFVILANVGMGCELDLSIVRKVMKKPIAPILGFVSQYAFMPMISFCVLLIIDLPASTALGYFGMGCAPGGGASNFYCLLLGGDVSLSITMTLISTAAALGMTPMYMLTLGQYILKSRNVDIQIPYLNILLSLVIILVPTALGYLIKVKLPRVAHIYRKVLKPAILVFVVFMFTVGVYANLYIWKLFDPALIAAGCALPYAGFILGGILAAVFRQPWPFVKTISLETGIQNPGVPIVILQTALPQPDADLSIVGPIAAATFTPMPLLLWVIGRFIYYKFVLKRSMFARPQDQQLQANDVNNEDLPEAGAFIAAAQGTAGEKTRKGSVRREDGVTEEDGL